MSTRIIIEKDGERYVANDLNAIFIYGGSALRIENELDNECVNSTFTRLPHIIRTDNSEVIANLEAENAKLREALKPIMACNMSFTDCVRAISKAQDFINGISRKDDDISRKGGAE